MQTRTVLCQTSGAFFNYSVFQCNSNSNHYPVVHYTCPTHSASSHLPVTQSAQCHNTNESDKSMCPSHSDFCRSFCRSCVVRYRRLFIFGTNDGSTAVPDNILPCLMYHPCYPLPSSVIFCQVQTNMALSESEIMSDEWSGVTHNNMGTKDVGVVPDSAYVTEGDIYV